MKTFDSYLAMKKGKAVLFSPPIWTPHLQTKQSDQHPTMYEKIYKDLEHDIVESEIFILFSKFRSYRYLG